MPFMVWNDRLRVDIEVLDADHKWLVGILNSLYDSIRSGAGRECLAKTLEGLAQYTRSHFAREEELFDLTGYPGADCHRVEHQKMIRWVQGMVQQLAGEAGAATSLEAVTYLKDWLFDHIMVSDRMYRSHFRAAGIH